MRKLNIFGLLSVVFLFFLFLNACGGGAKSPVTSSTGTLSIPSSTSVPATSTGSSTAGKAAGLIFITQPGGAKAGKPLATQPVVGVIDANAKIVENHVGSVNLRISTGDGEIDGATNVIFVKGLARFTDISINKAGSYILKAVSRELQSVESAPLTVDP